jgi:branched-chain amino acid transport system permease protein
VSVTEESPAGANPLGEISDAIESVLVRPRVYGQHQWLTWLGVAIVAALVPTVVTTGYWYNISINSELYVLLALGFYLQFALGGQFSFATPVYYGVGAYSFAWADPHVGFLAAFILAVALTAVLGALTKLLLLRSPLFVFAIATLALTELAFIVFTNWTALTGGDQGIFGINTPTIFGYAFDDQTRQYYLCAVVVMVGIALLIFFERSPGQRDLVFTRDMGPVAKTSGVRTNKALVTSFAAGAAYMGAAGALLASTAGFIDLTSFSIQVALLVLLMVLLGGVGSVWGPVIGAIVLYVLQEKLTSLSNYDGLIYALAILAVVLVLPGGLTSLPSEFRARVRTASGRRQRA